MFSQTSFKILKGPNVIYGWNNNRSIIREVYFTKLKGLNSTATHQICTTLFGNLCGDLSLVSCP